jgi:DNA-binding response OmpR family regulator
MPDHQVMIVEDDRSLLLLYRRVLEKQGYEVLTASDGRQAISLLEEYTPTIIFLDVRLPLIDGMQVLKHIRSRERFNQTRVVVNSSLHDYAQDVQDDEFVLKPIRPAQIAEIVAKRIRH